MVCRDISSQQLCIKETDSLICGYCSYTLSEKNEYIGGLKWNEIRQTSVLMPAESYGKVKEFIKNSCKQSNGCSK